MTRNKKEAERCSGSRRFGLFAMAMDDSEYGRKYVWSRGDNWFSKIQKVTQQYTEIGSNSKRTKLKANDRIAAGT